MKKVLMALLFMVLLLSACTSVEKPPDNHQNDANVSENVSFGAEEQSDNKQLAPENTKPDNNQGASDNTQAKNMLKAVVAGDVNFFETGLDQELNIRDLKNAVSSDSTITVEVEEYTVVDLDADGIDEIVLWLSVNGVENYGCEILRYHDEDVYGYLMWYRAFNCLKEDGTFSFSGGAMDSGFGKIVFDGKDFSTEKIAYSESQYGSDDEIIVTYFVNGEKVAHDQFEAEIQKQNKKPDSVRYEFDGSDISTLESNYDFAEVFAACVQGGQAAETAELILRENHTEALEYCMKQFDKGILDGLTFDSTGAEMCMYNFWKDYDTILLDNVVTTPQQDWIDWSQYVKKLYDLNGYDEEIFDSDMICARIYIGIFAEEVSSEHDNQAVVFYNISPYDSTLDGEIEQNENGWYVFPTVVGSFIGYDGEKPVSVTAYFTPTGTDMEQHKKQVGFSSPAWPQNPISVKLSFAEEDTLGHLYFVFTYGDGATVTSKLYNVLIEHTDEYTIERLKDCLQVSTGAQSGNLAKQFFGYYQEHNYELSMMPEFEGSLPNWDDLTLFVLLNSNDRMSVEGTQTLTSDAFAQTITRFFGEKEYTDGSSRYLAFEDGAYTAVSGDAMQNGYFWLKDLTCDGSSYTATFDAFYFTDADYTADYEQASSNQKAVRDYAGTKDGMQPSVFSSVMLEILEKSYYTDVLSVSETITISFVLSGDPEYPLIYTSCTVV